MMTDDKADETQRKLEKKFRNRIGDMAKLLSWSPLLTACCTVMKFIIYTTARFGSFYAPFFAGTIFSHPLLVSFELNSFEFSPA